MTADREHDTHTGMLLAVAAHLAAEDGWTWREFVDVAREAWRTTKTALCPHGSMMCPDPECGGFTDE